MTRPRKPRNCSCPCRAGYSAVFKPAGTPLKDMEIIQLAQDELETLHLCDGQGKTQEEAGICMGISRGTVQRLLSGARGKVARALVGQKALAISGGLPGKEVTSVPGENAAIDGSRGTGEGFTRLFEELRVAAGQQSEEAEFPSWLLADVLEIANHPQSYREQTRLVELLLTQIRNFDTYAGTGCFDTSVSAETVGATINRIMHRLG